MKNTSNRKAGFMKSIMSSTLLAFCLFFIGKTAFSQNNSTTGSTDLHSQADLYDGTWQIQVVNSRNQPYIPGNIDEIVRENRKKNEVVYIKLDDYIRIKILSADEISSAGFKPLEKVVHIEE